MSLSDDPNRSPVSDPHIFPPSADETIAVNDGSSPSGAAGDIGPTGNDKPSKSYRGVFIPSVVIGFLLALAVVVFLAQNTDKVQVSFLGWDGNIALAIVVLVVAFAAVVIDQIAGLAIRHRYRKMKNEREELKRLRGSR